MKSGFGEKTFFSLFAANKSLSSKKITESTGQKIIELLCEKEFDVLSYVKKEKLEAVSDYSQIEQFCKEAILENPKAIEDFKKGEEKALNFIVGSVMKKSKGLATPLQVNEILRKLI